MMKNICKQADFLGVCRGSIRDGLGHVIRLRSILELFPKNVRVGLVILGDQSASGLLDEVTFPVCLVSSEAEVSEAVISSDPRVVLWDMVFFSDAFFHGISEKRKQVSFCPTFEKNTYMDAIFHRSRYGLNVFPSGRAKVFSGLSYTVIRSRCRRIEEGDYMKNLHHAPISIAVCMGGADAANYTLRLLDSMREIKTPAIFWVLLGEGYVHSYEALIHSLRKDRRHEVILVKANESLWRILNNCILAVLAGGITTYEAAYAGLPSINVLEREDQYELIRELEEEGACLSAGVLSEENLEKLNLKIDELQADSTVLLHMHQRGKALLNESGNRRIVSRLMDFLHDE